MIIKKGILFAAIIISCGVAVAQQSGASPFVLPTFVNGTVLQKGGGTVQASLDYNVITQEMMFEKDGARLVLDQADNVDTIFLETRRFIPVKQVFYERLTNTSIALYIQYKAKPINSNNRTATASNNAAIGGFVGAKQAKGSDKIDNYALQLPSGYSLKFENLYWLEKDGQFYAASDLKKIAKLFPEKEVQINDFAKSNNINVSKIEDVIKLVEFANK